MVVWFDKDGLSENVLTKIMYFRVCRPVSAAAVGLYQVLKDSLQALGIHEASCAKLVGIGTDGASSNIARAGLKGLVEEDMSWMF